MQGDLAIWIHSVWSQRVLILNTICSSNSICLSLPFRHKHLPFPPLQNSSNPLSHFPSFGRLLTPLANKGYSFSPLEWAASSHLLPQSQQSPEVCEPAWEEVLGSSASHSLCFPGKRQQAEWRHWVWLTGCQLSHAALAHSSCEQCKMIFQNYRCGLLTGTLLSNIPDPCSMPITLLFFWFDWKTLSKGITAFLLCRSLCQFSYLAKEQRLWNSFHTVRNAQYFMPIKRSATQLVYMQASMFFLLLLCS